MKPQNWSALLSPFPPPFSSLSPSACVSLLQIGFNRVQPAQPERTPTMSQSNPGKCLQIQSGSRKVLMQGDWRSTYTGQIKQGKNYGSKTLFEMF